MGQICSKYKPKEARQALYQQQKEPEEHKEIVPAALSALPTNLPTNRLFLQYSYLPMLTENLRTSHQRSYRLEYISPVHDNTAIPQFNQGFSRFSQHHASLRYLTKASFDLKRFFS